MSNANFIVIATCNCRCCNWEGVHWKYDSTAETMP